MLARTGPSFQENLCVMVRDEVFGVTMQSYSIIKASGRIMQTTPAIIAATAASYQVI